MGEQPTEATAGAGDHHRFPVTSPTGEGRGDVDLLGHRPDSFLPGSVPTVQYSPLGGPDAGCTDQYNTRLMFTDADLLEMHRRMLVIRGFEERVAALYRDGEVPGLRAPVDRAGGVGRRRVLAAADRRT